MQAFRTDNLQPALLLLPEYRNLLAVATHELGHSMGLGHSSVGTSVMYPYYLTRWSPVQLDNDDVDGMQKIYGKCHFRRLRMFKVEC